MILAIIILAVAGWYFFLRDKPVPGANQTKTIAVEDVSFNYPGNWLPITLSEADKKASVLLKLGSTKPTGTFSWRILKGPLDKSVKVADLVNQVADSLTKEITGVKILSKELTKVGNLDAVKIRYTRPDTADPKKTTENLMYVIPRANQVDYLTFSAKGDDLGRLEPGFGKILDSYVAYTAAKP